MSAFSRLPTPNPDNLKHCRLTAASGKALKTAVPCGVQRLVLDGSEG
jgi:hypothetical protein